MRLASQWIVRIVLVHRAMGSSLSRNAPQSNSGATPCLPISAWYSPCVWFGYQLKLAA